MDLFSTPMSVDEGNGSSAGFGGSNNNNSSAPMDLFLQTTDEHVNSVTSTPMDLFSSTPSVLDELNTTSSSTTNGNSISINTTSSSSMPPTSDHHQSPMMASPMAVGGQKSSPVTPFHHNNSNYNTPPQQQQHQNQQQLQLLQSSTSKAESQTAFITQLEATIQFLKKNNLLATEEILRKETANFMNDDDLKIMREVNQKKVYYGLFKEPEFKMDMFDLDLDLDSNSNQTSFANDGAAGDGPTGSSLSKKKKTKKETNKSKKARNDPNAPALTRIPLPELRDAEQFEKMRARKEAMKAAKIGSDALPSICLYTILNVYANADTSAVCAEISDDSALLAIGLSDSQIRIFPLSKNNRLRALKSAADLEDLDKEADDVFLKMMDSQYADSRTLTGHSGPVYGLSFSPCKDLLLSCSEDTTIRLWSLLTWTNVVVYKGHCFPVWGVKFSPHGYYFASCSHDQTARLWATDNYSPLRYFAGHYSDVDCIQFHPNSNYVATGSTDRSVRMWDCLNGQCVRYMTGHKGSISALAFENSGRFLASAGADKRILIWDIASGHLVADLFGGHHHTIYTLSFNRGPEAIMLASGGLDNRVILWDIQRLFEDINFEELTPTSTPNIKAKHEAYMLAAYPTKSTHILLNHFTRRNLLISVGSFEQQ